MKNDVFEAKSSQDRSWGDLESIWVAKRGRLGRSLEGQVGSKKGRKSDAKKGLVLAWSWGEVDPIAVGSLWPGSNKGETGPGGALGPRARPASLHRLSSSLSCLCLAFIFIISVLSLSCFSLCLCLVLVFVVSLSLR